MSRERVGVGMMVACCVLVYSTGRAFAQPGAANVQAVRQLAAFVASSYEKYVFGTGDYKIADVDVNSRKVRAAMLRSANGQLVAGLKLKPLTSGGALPNARVVATFDVTQVVGTVTIEVAAVEAGNFHGVDLERVSQPGRYTLTGQPFTLEAGTPYEARGQVYMMACPEICGVSMRVVEVKWQIE